MPCFPVCAGEALLFAVCSSGRHLHTRPRSFVRSQSAQRSLPLPSRVAGSCINGVNDGSLHWLGHSVSSNALHTLPYSPDYLIFLAGASTVDSILVLSTFDRFGVFSLSQNRKSSCIFLVRVPTCQAIVHLAPAQHTQDVGGTGKLSIFKQGRHTEV
jgi:hypothetical protein